MTSRNIIVMPQSLSMNDMKLLSGPICKARGCATIGELVYDLLEEELENYEEVMAYNETTVKSIGY